MAVLSQDFGGMKLSGHDAEAFVRQVDSGKRTVRAQKTLAIGRQLLRQMGGRGKVIVSATGVKVRGK